jgi:hypothetical protein
MMKPATEMLEERIRERAYHLWEAGGRPHGRDQEFWARAHELIASEDHTPSGTRVRSTRSKSVRSSSSSRRNK